MSSVISRLNCFSKKNRGGKNVEPTEILSLGGEIDEVHKLMSLAPTRSESNSMSHTHRIGNSETFDGSKRSSPRGSSKSNESSALSPRLSTGHHYGNDDNSIPTMDSDYKQVNAGNFSLSDAGGTFNTHGQSLTNFSQMGSSAFGSTAPSNYERASFGDRASFGGHDYYNGPLMRQSERSHREEMLEIHAPAGKLGLVIDAPADSNTPIVHAIKDTCPIGDEIYVGDKLVAVDDVDVREMSAVDVSRLLSGKSGQKSRRLTIVRTARGRDGMY